jgi:DNA-binding GntR family transcriptional regulator
VEVTTARPRSRSKPRRPRPARRGEATPAPPRPPAAPRPRDTISTTYAKLRDLIVLGKLAPGTRIIEADVAARLGVSRTPVRSALHRLQQEGYVNELEGGRRARLMVTPLTRQDATELLHLMGQLDGLAGREAAHLPAADRRALGERMRAINARLSALRAAVRPDPNDFHDLDGAFHDAYVEAAAGPRLRALRTSIRAQTDRYVRVYVSAMAGEIGVSVEEHERIVRAIAAGDAPGAQRTIEDNWRNAAGRLASVIETLGERGSW